jgi:hypothetical protein
METETNKGEGTMTDETTHRPGWTIEVGRPAPWMGRVACATSDDGQTLISAKTIDTDYTVWTRSDERWESTSTITADSLGDAIDAYTA